MIRHTIPAELMCLACIQMEHVFLLVAEAADATFYCSFFVLVDCEDTLLSFFLFILFVLYAITNDVRG